MRNLLFIIAIVGFIGHAQDPLRFREEVAAIQKKYDTLWDSSTETVVFTGSSSIRLWQNLQAFFSEYQIVNSGFGGSQTSDLLSFTDELILKYKPKKVFIYEGDNDIFARKKSKEIIADTRQIIKKIKEDNATTKIVLIAVKPSLARWHLKRNYKRLNRKFKRLCKKDESLEFANIWDIMLEGRKVRKDIFIADGLHMNAKGYELWYTIIKKHIE